MGDLQEALTERAERDPDAPDLLSGIVAETRIRGGGLEFKTLDEVNRFARMSAIAGLGGGKGNLDQQEAMASVAIQRGAEVGLGPVESIEQIYIVHGKTSMSAGLVAALVKRSGRYDYRVGLHTDNGCEIAFFDRGKRIGVSVFTMADAKKAGLSGTNWKKYPRNMLWARAMTNGARWYCPDATGGAVYTSEELGDGAADVPDVVDGETGEVTPAPYVPMSEGEVDSAAAELRSGKGLLSGAGENQGADGSPEDPIPFGEPEPDGGPEDCDGGGYTVNEVSDNVVCPGCYACKIPYKSPDALQERLAKFEHTAALAGWVKKYQPLFEEHRPQAMDAVGRLVQEHRARIKKETEAHESKMREEFKARDAATDQRKEKPPEGMRANAIRVATACQGCGGFWTVEGSGGCADPKCTTNDDLGF